MKKPMLRDRLAFGHEARTRFYSMMRDFVRDGIPVYDALKEIEAGSRDFSLFPRNLVTGLMAAMRGASGHAPQTLGEGLHGWVDPIEAALIDAGQRAGKLDVGLNEAVDLMHAKGKIVGTALGAMVYPTFLVLMLGGFLLLVAIQVIPVMQDVLPRDKWPAIAQVLGWVADHVGLILGLMFGAIAVVVIAFLVTANNYVGEFRPTLDRYVMPWATYCQVQAAMVLTSISMMVEAGVPVGSAIEQLHSIGTKWQRRHFEAMQARMRKGMPEADAIVGPRESSMFDSETAWEVRLYGSRTVFAKSMKGLALRALNRIDRNIRMQSVVLRNLLLFLVAGMLALTFSSFMMITMSLGKRGIGMSM